MWETMCRVNDTGAYHATPAQVAQITTLHPSTQDTSRMTGHVSPRRRSSRYPVAYSAMASRAVVSQTQSGCHPSATRPNVGAGG